MPYSNWLVDSITTEATPTPDPPILTLLSVDSVVPPAAGVSVTTDTATGTIYWGVTSDLADADVSSGELIAGYGDIDQGSQVVSASGSQSITVGNIPASGQWNFWLIHEVSGVSSAPTYIPITAAPPAVVLSNAYVEVEANTLSAVVHADLADGTYYFAGRYSAPYTLGDAEIIKAATGADFDNSGPASFNIAEMGILSDPGTTLYIGFVVENSAGFSNVELTQGNTPAISLDNETVTETGDGAILTCTSTSDVGTIYVYSKTTPFSGSESENAAEIMANGIGAQANFSNSITVTGQDPLTKHYAGWVQDTEGYGADMVLVFDMGAGESLEIPGGAGTYDYEVNWGDLTAPDTWEPYTSVPATHTYTGDVAGEKTVIVRGTFPHVNFNNGGDIGKLIRILNWGDTSWLSCASAFRGAGNLVEASSEVSNTRSVTSMSYMMHNWTSMTSPPDLSSFDTISVTNMAYMMYGWTAMESPPDLSSFDTISVTNMYAMMRDWSSMGAIDIAIDQWDVGSVTNFGNLLASSQLNTVCYDRTLRAWSVQTLVNTTDVHFGNSTYSDTDAHAAMVANVGRDSNGLLVIDGGLAS